MHAFAQKQAPAQKDSSQNSNNNSWALKNRSGPLLTIQSKLAISSSGDIYEQEADRISEQVMRMSEPRVQHSCPCGGGCPACQSKPAGGENERLQTKRVPAGDAGDTGQIAAPPIVHEVLRSPGKPLDPATRAFMEPRFGHDFSQVRVHSDAVAGQSARDINANAYTVGQDIVFGAGHYAPGTHQGRSLLAHELAHVVQQSDNVGTGVDQRNEKRRRSPVDTSIILRDIIKPTQPAMIKQRDEITDRIDNAYGAGSLDETQWSHLIDLAEQAYAKKDMKELTRAYLTLYADAAKLAQATRVISLGSINIVTGSKNNCNNARPGLNLSLGDMNEWGANATTALVNDNGKFGVRLNRRGAAQPEVAIVLSRSAFHREKERTLAALRHEMVHAEHYNEDAAEALMSDPRDNSKPAMTSSGDTEVLAYIEGFMTMFHLSDPAPTSSDHPAFVQLLGALSTTDGHPWAEANETVRSKGLGRIQEYYCHALDQRKRKAFDAWVGYQLTKAHMDEIMSGEPSQESYPPGSVDAKTYELRFRGGDVWGAKIRVQTLQGDFFRGLHKIIRSECKGLRSPTPMKL